MTKRAKFFVLYGMVLILIVGSICLWCVRRAGSGLEEESSVRWAGGPDIKGPRIQLGYEAKGCRVINAIHIDVRLGIPYARANDMMISNVSQYITDQLKQKHYDWVVITAAKDEKFGDVLRIVDTCRKTHVDGIILNYNPLEQI